MTDKAKIAFIGCGNMGRSLIGGLINNGYDSKLIQASDPDEGQREVSTESFGIVTSADNKQVVNTADVVVLAVKPQVIKQTLVPLAELFQDSDRLLISIAAGIQLHHLNHWLHESTPIIRVMPNTPALVQSGAAGMIANPFASAAHKEIAEKIMRSVGIAFWFENESDIDIVTALSGSGPAYYFLIMEAMEHAGISMGLAADQARQLTLATALGAAKMAIQSDLEPAMLRHQVTSPGGTTERAIDVLLGGNITGLFKEALEAARARSEELAKQMDK